MFIDFLKGQPITVFSAMQAEDYTRHKHDETSIIVSIVDDSMHPLSFVEHKDNGVLAVKRWNFDDTDNAKDEKCITIEQGMQIAAFVNEWWGKVDRIIVHCGAGVSRSAGTAAAIYKAKLGDDSVIFDSKFFNPNMLCYRRILDAFSVFDFLKKI